MTDEELLNELTADLPLNARRAVRAALRAATDETTDPRADFVSLMRLGHVLAGGAVPPVAVLISAVAGAVGLLKWAHKKKKRRISKSRRNAMSAGLNARRASRATSARMQAQRSANAYGRARRAAKR